MAKVIPNTNTITGFMPMSEYRPSKYILHSGYATVKTYDIIETTLVIPDTVVVGLDDVVYTVEINLPSNKGFGWRSIVETSKDTDSYDTYDSFVYGEVIRSTSYSIQLRIVFSGNYLGGATYTNVEQTFKLRVQPYLSPFES